MKKLKPLLLKFCSSLIIILLIIEVGLRLDGRFNSYTESIGLGYFTDYNKTDPDGLHIYKPNTKVIFDQPEFQIIHPTNSIGLVDKEFSKQEDTYRIIALGDSFTQGDGAQYGYSYPKHLERLLNEKKSSTHYEVINAGICGSDIFFMDRLLEEKLMDYHPDAVIFLLNTSEIEEIIYRGGNERFRENGSAVFKKSPLPEPLIRFSHLARLILNYMGYSDLYLLADEEIESRKNSLNIIGSKIKEINAKIGADVNCAFVVHPIPSTIKYYPNYSDLEELLAKSDSSLFYTNKYLIDEKIMYLEGIINLYPKLYSALGNMEFKEYAWPINNHFNTYGYETLANSIFESILEVDSTFFESK